MSTDSTTPEEHSAAKALTSFAAKMRDMADAMEKVDRMIYERLILGLPAQPAGRYAMVQAGPFAHSRYLVGGVWHGSDGKQRTWPEVCALGTPEVLEPETVKALREQVEHWKRVAGHTREQAEKAEARAEKAEREVEEFIAIDIDRSADAEDEPAEPAPVEVTESPSCICAVPLAIGNEKCDRCGGAQS